MTPIQNNGGPKGGRNRSGGQGPIDKNRPAARPRQLQQPRPAWKYPDRPGAPQPSQRRRRQPRAPSLTVGQAILAELQDFFQRIWYYIFENGESIIKGVVLGLLLVIFLLLQTTFFVQFSPFGTVPDLLLSMTVAVAVSEGEKWGAVFGLVAAYLSQALGGVNTGFSLLPLFYMSAGYFCGICAVNYLSDSIPVRGIYIAASGVGRGVVTTICAASVLNASLGEILLHIVIPEFFSTALLAPGIYGLIYLVLRPFHKSRAQRTGA